MVLVLVLSGLGMFALALHPFAIYPQSLKLLRRLRAQPTMPPCYAAPRLTFSLVTCAFNEETAAASLVQNRREVAAFRDAEILLYDDGSADRTAEIIADASADVTLVRGLTRRGKTYGMNRLLERATGEIVVFSDANVALAPDVLERLESYFADPTVGCVCGHLLYVNETESPTAATGCLYWRREERLKTLETETGSTMGADGSLFAIRRHLYRPIPEDLIDDMFTSLSILADGYRVIRADDARAYERSACNAKDEFRRKVRIACQAVNVHRALWPRLKSVGLIDRYKYVSHKVLRWLAPFTALGGSLFIGLAILMSFNVVVVMSLALLGLGLALMAVASRPALAGKAWNILVAFAGVGLGVVQSFRGTRYQIWTPAASVR